MTKENENNLAQNCKKYSLSKLNLSYTLTYPKILGKILTVVRKTQTLYLALKILQCRLYSMMDLNWQEFSNFVSIFARFGSFPQIFGQSFSLSVAYFTVANLVRLGILILCQVSVRSRHLFRLLSLCWITGGYPPIKGLLSPAGIKPTPSRNLASKVAGLQGYATTPG